MDFDSNYYKSQNAKMAVNSEELAIFLVDLDFTDRSFTCNYLDFTFSYLIQNKILYCCFSNKNHKNLIHLLA